MFNNLFLIKKNKKLFKYDSSNKKIILVEYNNYYGSHLCQALLSNFFKKKNPAKIIAYYNYCLIVSPLKLNFFQKVKWCFSKFFLLGFKRIYKSFGVEDFIRPEIDDNMKKKAIKTCKFFFRINVTNENVEDFKIKNILIGDLIYDTYLKSKNIPTFDPNSIDFKNFFLEFLELFFFWQHYLKKNKVNKIIGVHSCYSYGILIRIGINFGIPSYVINSRAVMKLDKRINNMHGDYIFHKNKFSKLGVKFKKIALSFAKKKLDSRIRGKIGSELINRSVSSFSQHKNRTKKVLRINKRIKILICTHDFMDSVHVNGKNFFPDFYEWISFLGRLSNDKKNEYDFYIKNHPNFGNKYERYQQYTNLFVNQLCEKFPNIKKIDNNVSHHQIISEGINFVLTVYGSVAIEYAYLGIPVINATLNNPHINYNFNINPKNKKNYIQILNNLKTVKLIINKKEIYECYFMKHFYYDENWLFDNYQEFLDEIGGYQNLHTNRLYNYWSKYVDSNIKNKIFNRFENFEETNEYRLSILHSKKEELYI
jgi:hypothetical protein